LAQVAPPSMSVRLREHHGHLPSCDVTPADGGCQCHKWRRDLLHSALTGARTPSQGFLLASPAWVTGDRPVKRAGEDEIMGVNGDGIDPDIGNVGGASTSSPRGEGHSDIGRAVAMMNRGAVLEVGLLIILLTWL
jgi:hypothetical protein